MGQLSFEYPIANEATMKNMVKYIIVNTPGTDDITVIKQNMGISNWMFSNLYLP